jgi:hypothetical protein
MFCQKYEIFHVRVLKFDYKIIMIFIYVRDKTVVSYKTSVH